MTSRPKTSPGVGYMISTLLISIPGVPTAGPCVTVTEIEDVTSGLRAVPLSETSRNRIV